MFGSYAVIYMMSTIIHTALNIIHNALGIIQKMVDFLSNILVVSQEYLEKLVKERYVEVVLTITA